MSFGTPRKSKSGFHLTTFLRLIPIAVMGLLPYRPLDEALLQTLYSLRGQIEAPEHLKVFTYQSPIEIEPFLKAMKSNSPAKCFVLVTDEHMSTEPCLKLSMEDFYSSELLEQHFLKSVQYLKPNYLESFPKTYQPWFLGDLNHFNPRPLGPYFLDKHNTVKSEALYIALPSFYKAKIRITTGIGNLTAPEIALNVIANASENKSLMRTSRSVQFIFCLITSLICVSILYSYPIFLTMLFLLGLAGAETALAVIALDRFQIALPLAPSFVTLIITCLVGMSDRLDRRERREWSLEQEAQSLTKLDEMRNNFLSLVSHDLKTPIAKMQSLLEQLSREDFGKLTDPQREEIQKALSTNGHLRRSISTLLLLSRVESRDIKIDFQPTDLKTLLEEISEPYQLLASEKNVRLNLEFEPMFLVDLDQALIKEVAHNLIDNALKYSPMGSIITLRCGEQEICSELLPPQAGVWFEIQDQGPGIPPQDRTKVFQKFERGSQEFIPSDQTATGTGLGLFLTQYFVEQHHGRVMLFSRQKGEKLDPLTPRSSYFDESQDQSGTVLRVVLPIEHFEAHA